MLLDSLLQLSDPQAITVDAISEHVIDLGPLSSNTPGTGATANSIRDIGAGEPLHLSILVTTAFVSAGGATLTVALESDSTANLATSATVHVTVASAVAAATLVAGYWIAQGILIPPGAYERYLGLRYTTNTSDFEAGAVKAWLHKGRFDTRTYYAATSTGVS
jgi:hypothetical protein